MDLVPLYWLAGILEGEGTFLSGPPSHPNSPIVRIVMTDLDVVTRAAGILARAVTPARPRKAHYKPPFITQIKGTRAVGLMTAIRPVLGPNRRAQLDRAVAGWVPARVQPEDAPPRFPSLTRIDVTRSDDPHALSWLAGLLEGEASFTITCDAARNCYPVIAVQMCDAAVVFRTARMLEISRVGFREPEDQEWQPTYVAKIAGARAAEWMRLLRPFMGERRRAAIDLALSSYRPVHLVSPPGTCVVANCGRPHRGRGLCHKHYMMWSRDKAKGRPARITPLR